MGSFAPLVSAGVWRCALDVAVVQAGGTSSERLLASRHESAHSFNNSFIVELAVASDATGADVARRRGSSHWKHGTLCLARCDSWISAQLGV
mmetsp:Transcript_29141/g.67764  ORF Transcript_29141/g.67764 Transcript_29141/m.67764 type:complete len:92 (-) Transcript_29141:1268-1543(-)